MSAPRGRRKGARPRRSKGEGARDAAPRSAEPAKGRRRGRGRRKPRQDDPVAPLAKAQTLDLDQDREAPLADREQREAERHLAFLKRFKTALRLSLNAKEDLLVNGAKAPEDRGVLKHLFQKVDKAAVERALAREPLKSDVATRSAFLAGVVRLQPDTSNLLAYLETLAGSADRRVGARAFGATCERIDFSTLSAAQLSRLLEVCRATFDGPDRVQAFFGLLDSPSFRDRFEAHADDLPRPVQDDLRPLAAAHRAVSSDAPLPDDETARARIAEGVRRWVQAPAEVLASYPLEHRARLAEFMVAAADGTAPDALPPALMDSLPRDHPSYARLGLAWSEKLTQAGQVEAARGLLDQVTRAHPERRDAARRKAALEGERAGPLVLGERRLGRLRAAFWLEEAAHGWLELAPASEAEALAKRARWQADLLLPGVAPSLTAGRLPDGRGYLLLSAAGGPTPAARRGLMEALRLTRDAVAILRGLATAGVALPDGRLERFWGDGRKHPLTLVDLDGAEKSDEARATMGLAAPARELARALLWDERRGALRADLPDPLREAVEGRGPVTMLARALVLACAR